MRMIVRALKAASDWLDRRFPEKVTAAEVMARFVEYETRLAVLEKSRDMSDVRSEIAKLKMINGIQMITGVNGE